MIKLSSFQKGYIAAMIDGEGTISLSRRWSKNRQRHFLLAEIVVANTCLPLLEYVKSVIGGSIGKPLKNHEKHKKIYKLERRDMTIVRNLCIILIPYLIVKKRQAELMIEYCNNRLAVGKTWTKAYTERDFQLWEQMKILNKRGL